MRALRQLEAGAAGRRRYVCTLDSHRLPGCWGSARRSCSRTRRDRRPIHLDALDRCVYRAAHRVDRSLCRRVAVATGAAVASRTNMSGVGRPDRQVDALGRVPMGVGSRCGRVHLSRYAGNICHVRRCDGSTWFSEQWPDLHVIWLGSHPRHRCVRRAKANATEMAHHRTWRGTRARIESAACGFEHRSGVGIDTMNGRFETGLQSRRPPASERFVRNRCARRRYRCRTW